MLAFFTKHPRVFDARARCGTTRPLTSPALVQYKTTTSVARPPVLPEGWKAGKDCYNFHFFIRGRAWQHFQIKEPIKVIAECEAYSEYILEEHGGKFIFFSENPYPDGQAWRIRQPKDKEIILKCLRPMGHPRPMSLFWERNQTDLHLQLEAIPDWRLGDYVRHWDDICDYIEVDRTTRQIIGAKIRAKLDAIENSLAEKDFAYPRGAWEIAADPQEDI